jgi:Phytochelatin synthase
VRRYEYPPLWMKASELFNAMNTTADNENKTRGFVLISKPVTTAPANRPSKWVADDRIEPEAQDL